MDGHASPPDGPGEIAGQPREPGRRRPDSTYLTYLFAPLAIGAILFLMHFGVVAHESAWLWLLVFSSAIVFCVWLDEVYVRRPLKRTLFVRVGMQMVAVTVVIYLTGWGPVLWGAFAFLALENVAFGGSGTWRMSAFWILICILGAQIGLWRGWVPSELSLDQSLGICLVGAFVLVFVIRMAGATMEEKEDAEAAVRLSEDRYRSLVQNSSDVTLVIGGSGEISYVSPAIVDLLGLQPGDLVGIRATDTVHPDDRERVTHRLGSQLQVEAVTTLVQFRMQRHDGTWCDVEAVVSNQLDRASVSGYVANIRNITERKEFEALLAHRALHDPLTGLANRQLILDRADQMLVRARRTCEPVAVYFIDLDNFKDANDSLGHEAGDKVLQAAADRLLGLLRASDTVGRMGGDEFVVLAEGLSLAAGPELVAERIHQVLEAPFLVEGFEEIPISITASIGIATGDRSSARELLRDADIALYRSKAAGRNRWVVFEPAMQSAAHDRLELKSDLAAAFANDEFFLLYQPIFDLEYVKVSGVEALLRWQHPTKGIITPDKFIPVLEDSGLIVDVGRWVLDEACRQAARWRERGFRTTMSVNVSMRQLESDQLVEDVRSALEEHDIEPSSLIIEVTESTLMKDANATVSRLNRLKGLGVMIAIDDFGTGYSSLAYLRQFPVDVLKIDRSFVSEMDGSADGTALIHTLVELGRTLGLVTLAEGIEKQSQLEGLRGENCDSGQGFIFSRPVEASAIEALLSREPGDDVLRAPVPISGLARSDDR